MAVLKIFFLESVDLRGMFCQVIHCNNWHPGGEVFWNGPMLFVNAGTCSKLYILLLGPILYFDGLVFDGEKP